VSYNAICTETGMQIPTQCLLSMKRLLANEIEGMTAADHLTLLSRVLNINGRITEHVLCIVGDKNCSVNRRMAGDLDVPLLDYGSHKCNFAVRTWIKQQPHLLSIIGKVASVMKKASTLKIAAKLRKLTAYSTVCENDTRWSSTFQMLSRFFKIQQQLGVIVELLELLPTHVEINILSKALRSLSKFNQITVMLQGDGISFVEAQQIFDAVLLDYLDHHLGDKASIVESPAFENAVMRIASGLPLSKEQLCIAGC